VSSTTTRWRSGRLPRASCTGSLPSRCGLTFTVRKVSSGRNETAASALPMASASSSAATPHSAAAANHTSGPAVPGKRDSAS
jgi:hypothetical protein